MCGLVVSKHVTEDVLVRRRGTDGVGTLEYGGYNFRHYLLHVTGKKTLQPFADGKIFCVYNGEIYNHPYERTDGDALLPLYRFYGPQFTRYLDGEFALALYDFDTMTAVFATDPFGTKPLWMRRTEVASYESALEGSTKIPANTTVIFDLNTGEEKARLPTYVFDFKHQEKDTYDGWIGAFVAAVEKRATPTCFLGLSSGYDSGGIVQALQDRELPFKAYTIMSQENPRVVHQRHAKIQDGQIIHMTEVQYKQETDFVMQHVEPFIYMPTGRPMQADPATRGLSLICRLAKTEERKVYLSGQGSDEILCDYSPFKNMTTLGGFYPDDLKPWPNFFGWYQEAFLMKEEHVAGAHAIEARYPYLDTDVVQEFLWLTPELKNKRYKAPLHEYLVRTEHPFKPGQKLGFSAQKGLR
jgi:asparagine synthase (glutamine-hydrolysing)